MAYVWDEQKRISNLRKHGVDFVDAVAVFDDDTVMMEDNRFEYGEQRFVSLGLVQGHVMVVVHTELVGETRIISARKATRYEQRLYFQGIAD